MVPATWFSGSCPFAYNVSDFKQLHEFSVSFPYCFPFVHCEDDLHKHRMGHNVYAMH